MNRVHNLILTTLSPLHIGGGKELTSIGEYVILDGSINIIDQEYLFDLLKEKKLYKDYISFILDEERTANVWDGFFVKHEIAEQIKFLKTIPFVASLDFNVTNNNILELATTTKNQLYIPGSSIKGVLRSMFFSNYILSNHQIKQKIEHIVTEYLQKDGEKWNNKRKLKAIINEVHEQVEATSEINTIYTKIGIADSELVKKEAIQIEIANRVNLFVENTGSIDLLRECISENTPIKFEFRQKTVAHRDFLFLNDENITSIFHVLNTISKKYIDFEIRLLKKSNSTTTKDLIKNLENLLSQIEKGGNEFALLRMGKGKTLFFQTILPVLSDSIRNSILNLFVNDYQYDEFPQTRVLNANNNMFGWVKIGLPVIKLEMKDNVQQQIELQKTQLIVYNIDNKTARFLLNGQEHIAQLVRPHKSIKYKKNEELKTVVHQISKDAKINQIKVI